MAHHSLVTIQKAWNGYIENGVLDVQQLRPEVANSWKRCRNLNVNPFQEVDGYINQLELRERLYNKQHLLKVARPFMDSLYNFVKGSGFQVVLTDEHGFLLEVLGDNEIVSRTQNVHLCPGGNWSEAVKGTNAIGTAIIEKKPVQIYAWEHYCQPHHFLTCSAAPIFDQDGELIGVLDISGDYRVANAHTLGMVVAAVNAIENQFRLLKATDKLYMAYRYSNALLENMSDGLISINNNGIVTEINAKGGEIFGVNPALVKGRHVDQIFNARASILQVLSDGAGYEDREIIIEKMGKKIYSSASLLRDDAGGVIGAVAVFREMNNRQLVKRPTILHSHCYTFDDIIGESMAMVAHKTWARLAAASSSTVLINGESGTGKELFAQAIHNASPRKDRQFIAINCAALPENLIESELFGYEEGTFTGAKRGGQAGKFEIADGGTIFLDEIGDMSLSVQAKLLRVIQEKKVARIGSASERPVDIRIIAATHKDLAAEVQQGNFRQDLYYRLNVLEIRVPSLRERTEDLPLLTEHLTRKIAAKLGRTEIRIQDGFLREIQLHSWPGNIRELENAIERAIIRAREGGLLTAELLDFHSQEPSQAAPIQEAKPTRIKSLREAEKDNISEALAFYEGNILKAAAKLGIGRNTLYRKMKEYDIYLA
ncbi:MAG: sigma-54-dependent Fis family transcriptional regulator [Desulfuromonadaceae bacterium GWB2_53_15]|nr:MAG: sigma-54-dependent Fis family transcriptional regulator [Desulfuromonadaceae bacterium GWB2_53_15]